jgi:hypothetical protein
MLVVNMVCLTMAAPKTTPDASATIKYFLPSFSIALRRHRVTVFIPAMFPPNVTVPSYKSG